MLAEQVRKVCACASEPLAYGIRANAEDLGDLTRLHALDADEQCNFTILRRERGESTLERELRLRIA